MAGKKILLYFVLTKNETDPFPRGELEIAVDEINTLVELLERGIPTGCKVVTKPKMTFVSFKDRNVLARIEMTIEYYSKDETGPVQALLTEGFKEGTNREVG